MAQLSTSKELLQFELPDIILSRRAIFNVQKDVVAYELQIDGKDELSANEREESNTAELLLQLIDNGLQSCVDNLTAFIPISKSYVKAGLPLIENVNNVVFEIPDGLLQQGEKQRFFALVKRPDLRFAWVHPKPDSLDSEMLKWVSFVKLDVSNSTPTGFRSLLEYYRSNGIKTIADQVSSPSMFEFCKELGFDFFMGYFFCMPSIVDQKQVPASKISVLQLICELQNPEVTFERVQEIVEKDVSLSYRILRYINSPVFQFPKKIDSIKNAILIAGLNTIKTLSVIVAHSKIVDKPPELFKIALMRARMCDTLAKQRQMECDSAFLLGLFSTLDALTDMRMSDICSRLPLSDDIRNILVNYTSADTIPECQLLNAVVRFEQGNWASFSADTDNSYELHDMRDHYWNAVNWVSDVLSQLCGPQLSKI